MCMGGGCDDDGDDDDDDDEKRESQRELYIVYNNIIYPQRTIYLSHNHIYICHIIIIL